jgi:hypothetical protein
MRNPFEGCQQPSIFPKILVISATEIKCETSFPTRRCEHLVQQRKNLDLSLDSQPTSLQKIEKLLIEFVTQGLSHELYRGIVLTALLLEPVGGEKDLMHYPNF